VKINEVIVEGLGRAIGAIGKGLAKDFYGADQWERDFGKPNQPGLGGSLGRAAKGVKSMFKKPTASTSAPSPTAAEIDAAAGEEPSPTGSVREPLTPGVTVVKSMPLTLRYQKRDFLLNKQDVWVMLGPQPKAASPEMQDFLNSEAIKL
jgi:hypothetical protein